MPIIDYLTPGEWGMWFLLASFIFGIGWMPRIADRVAAWIHRSPSGR